jgi:hypothetical protein
MAAVSTMEPGGPLQIVRAARALVGWMKPDEGERIQHGNRQDEPVSDESRERARLAREAVAARPQGLEQAGALSPAPPELDAHIAALHQHSMMTQFFAEGWEPCLVDLTRVVALQPNVFIDHASERVRDVDATSVASIAAVSIPVPGEAKLPAQFDESKNAWVVTAPNPNLRIVGHFSMPIQPGVIGCGFAITLSPSFLQIARFQGRLFLRDGYHRAVGFLERGITIVPALTKEFGKLDSLGLPAEMLQQVAYFGDQPPCLPDYLDEAVSVQVQLPALQKMLVIQGLELTSLG